MSSSTKEEDSKEEVVEEEKQEEETNKISHFSVSISQIREESSEEEDTKKNESNYGFKYKITGTSSMYSFDENKFIPLRSGEIVNSSRELLNEDSLSGLANGKLSIRLVFTHRRRKRIGLLGQR